MLRSIALSVCALCMSGVFAQNAELVDSNQKAGMVRQSSEMQEGSREEPLNGPNTPAQRKMQDRYGSQKSYGRGEGSIWEGSSVSIFLPGQRVIYGKVVDDLIEISIEDRARLDRAIDMAKSTDRLRVQFMGGSELSVLAAKMPDWVYDLLHGVRVSRQRSEKIAENFEGSKITVYLGKTAVAATVKNRGIEMSPKAQKMLQDSFRQGHRELTLVIGEDIAASVQIGNTTGLVGLFPCWIPAYALCLYIEGILFVMFTF